LTRNLGTRDGEFGAFERLLWIDCSPTVDWLIDELDLTAEESLLDCGAGEGNHFSQSTDLRPPNPRITGPRWPGGQSPAGGGGPFGGSWEAGWRIAQILCDTR
jgi:hypothetical protein